MISCTTARHTPQEVRAFDTRAAVSRQLRHPNVLALHHHDVKLLTKPSAGVRGAYTLYLVKVRPSPFPLRMHGPAPSPPRACGSRPIVQLSTGVLGRRAKSQRRNRICRGYCVAVQIQQFRTHAHVDRPAAGQPAGDGWPRGVMREHGAGKPRQRCGCGVMAPSAAAAASTLCTIRMHHQFAPSVCTISLGCPAGGEWPPSRPHAEVNA